MSETMESTRAVRSSGSRWLVPCSITRARCRSIRPSDNSTTGSGALLVFDEVVTARLAHGGRRPRRRGPLPRYHGHGRPLVRGAGLLDASPAEPHRLRPGV